MLCAYVGPADDFHGDGKQNICPKCHRYLNTQHVDSETIGYCYTCPECGYEESEGTQ
jgi:predicted RNA-binding Zn-ribbon protein involved in translation (DUF1610 family)